MKVLLYQLDGKLPNLALMRIAGYARGFGDEVELRGPDQIKRQLWDTGDETVFASLIFDKSKPLQQELVNEWPAARVGGTGSHTNITLEEAGIKPGPLDYSIYPGFRQSMGFTQRGCRLKCPFCVVPKKEGAIRFEQTISDLWRGDPWPREVILMDNDFFGQPDWAGRIAELQEGKFKVSFNQGINVRFLTDESAAAIASVNYRDDSMKTKRIYTAWDSTKDEKRVFTGLDFLAKHGVKPDHIMVYMLIGYWPRETVDDWVYRQKRLREFGCRPYPMPFVRTKESVGFQRWCIGAYDKKINWEDWKAANYDPRKLGAAEEDSTMWTEFEG